MTLKPDDQAAKSVPMWLRDPSHADRKKAGSKDSAASHLLDELQAVIEMRNKINGRVGNARGLLKQAVAELARQEQDLARIEAKALRLRASFDTLTAPTDGGVAYLVEEPTEDEEGRVVTFDDFDPAVPV